MAEVIHDPLWSEPLILYRQRLRAPSALIWYTLGCTCDRERECNALVVCGQTNGSCLCWDKGYH